MGWSSIKKSVKTAGRQIGSGATKAYKEYDRYTSSKAGAYLTPYLSMYDDDGRAALSKAYGGYASTGVSTANPAAGAVLGTAVSTYDSYSDTYGTPRNTSAFTPPGDAPAVAMTPSDGLDAWKIAAIVVGGVLVVGVVALMLKRKGR